MPAELAGNLPLRCPRKLSWGVQHFRSCQKPTWRDARETVHRKISHSTAKLPEEVLGEASGTGSHWPSHTTGARKWRSQLCCSFWVWRSCVCRRGWTVEKLGCRTLTRSTPQQEEKPLLPPVSTQHFLLTRVNIVPVGQGVLFARSISIIIEQTVKRRFGAETQ